MKWLLEKFGKYPGRTAIIYSHKFYNYSELAGKIRWYDYYLDLKGILPGNIVLLISNFSFHAVALLLSLAQRGNIVAPVELNKAVDIKKIARESYSDHIIRFNGEEPVISSETGNIKHPLIERLKKKNKAGLILFSSGTTGEPKVMLHDFTDLIESYKNSKVKDLNSLILLGFDHIGGIDSLLRLLSICATITLAKQHNPFDICKLIEKYKINVLPATPTFLNLLIISEAYKRYNLSSLKIIGYGAEQMPEVLLSKIRHLFPFVQIQQKYGTTETNAIKIINKPGDEQYFKINDEKIEYKIINNVLWLKSKNNILGYLNSETPLIRDGWINTGDLVEVREDGFIKILGRKKDMINVGGEKVLPTEVENILMEFQGIIDCKVYGIPNLITGNVVGADIVLRDATSESIKSEIRKFCKSRLPDYKVPVKLKIVDVIQVSTRQKKIRNK